MNKALALTYSGMTDVCASEIKELIGVSGKETKEGVLFEATKEQLLIICYRAQSVSRVLQIVSEGEFDKLKVPKTTGTASFNGKSSSKAQELSETYTGEKVYKNADVAYYLHFEDDKHWLGIDLGDLSKRDYRIFIGSETLTGMTAFAALKLAGYDGKKTLMDPFCRAGTIAIEAALHSSKFAVRYHSKDKVAKQFKDIDAEKIFAEQDKKVKDAGKVIAISPKFPSVQATRKNAQIAGVVKKLDFSRVTNEDIDLKFDKPVDFVVTQPPELSRSTNPERFAKDSAVVFKQLSLVAKTICLVLRRGTEDYIKAATEFKLKHQRTIMQKKEEWNVLVFSKN